MLHNDARAVSVRSWRRAAGGGHGRAGAWALAGAGRGRTGGARGLRARPRAPRGRCRETGPAPAPRRPWRRAAHTALHTGQARRDVTRHLTPPGRGRHTVRSRLTPRSDAQSAERRERGRRGPARCGDVTTAPRRYRRSVYLRRSPLARRKRIQYRSNITHAINLPHTHTASVSVRSFFSMCFSRYRSGFCMISYCGCSNCLA
jgi:hypothetical protein